MCTIFSILERELSSDSLVIHQGVQKIKSILKDIYELTFQALELHMVKIIMFSIMIMCIYEVRIKNNEIIKI